MFGNHRMGSALLSRFDLVFILLDKPDEVRDFKKLFFIQFIRNRKIPISFLMIPIASKKFVMKNSFSGLSHRASSMSDSNNFISFKIHTRIKLQEIVVHAKYTNED